MKKLYLYQIINYLKFKYFGKSEYLRYNPIHLSVSSTDRCNLKCDFCHVHSPNIGEFDFKHEPCPDINIDIFKDIIDRFKYAVSVSIIGSGEPLLNKDFYKMVQYAKKKRMLVRTSTNGIFPKKHLEELINSGLDELEISLNAHDEESYYRNTGMPKTTFNKILNNSIELVARRNASKSKLKIILTCVIDRNSYIDVPKVIETSEKIGGDCIAFQQFLPTPTSGFTAKERCIFDTDLEIIAFLKEIHSRDHKIKVVLPEVLSKERKVCTSYSRVLRIDGKGNVGGCAVMLLNNEGNGNFREENIWNNDHFKVMRQKFLSKDTSVIPEPCQYCTSSSGKKVF